MLQLCLHRCTSLALITAIVGTPSSLFSIPIAAAASPPSPPPPSTTITIHAWPVHEPSPTPLATVKYEAATGNATLLSYTPPKVAAAASSSSSSSLKKRKEKQKGGDGKGFEAQSQEATRELDLVRVGLYDGKPLEKGGRWTGVVLGRLGLAGAVDADDDDAAAAAAAEKELGKRGEEIRTTLVLNVDADGVVYGIGVGAERVKKKTTKDRGKAGNKSKVNGGGKDGKGMDAGAGPNVVVEVSRQTMGPRPVLNKPIVLDADGKRDDQQPEKSFLQKYWWVIALFLLVQVLASGGGSEEK